MDESSKPQETPKKKLRGKPWTKATAPKSPGRPPAAAEAEYLRRVKAGCSLDDLEQIARAGVRFALKGDVAWARWLTEQLGTVAAQKIEQRITSTIAFTDDISKILADPDATTRLLDAVQGQTIAVPAIATAPKSEAKAVGNGNGTAAH